LTNKTGKVIGVACGQFCSFLLTESGKVIGFGLNNCFQLGFDDREIRYIPTIIPFKFDEKDDLKFTQVQSGMHHTMLLSDEGTHFCRFFMAVFFANQFFKRVVFMRNFHAECILV
jgi:alpha-tubulin suppressor-like RCC1 family protein